MLELFGII